MSFRGDRCDDGLQRQALHGRRVEVMAAEHKKHGTHGTAQREEAGINRRNAIGEGWKWDRVRMGDRRRRVDWTDWDKEIS